MSDYKWAEDVNNAASIAADSLKEWGRGFISAYSQALENATKAIKESNPPKKSNPDKPKKPKKLNAKTTKRLIARIFSLNRELSATRAMLAEAQKEIAELQAQPIPPHVQQSWYEDGWGDGAADMLKAAQNAEAGLIGEYNASHENMDTVRGAAFVVGAIANAFQQGR